MYKSSEGRRVKRPESLSIRRKLDRVVQPCFTGDREGGDREDARARAPLSRRRPQDRKCGRGRLDRGAVLPESRGWDLRRVDLANDPRLCYPAAGEWKVLDLPVLRGAASRY